MHVNSTAALEATTFRSPISKPHCALEVVVSAAIRARGMRELSSPFRMTGQRAGWKQRITAGRLKLPMGIHSRDRTDKQKLVEDALQRRD
jgi:hypothetical protein